MPAEFQKAMDYTLIGLRYTYCFLDDILVLSKGSLEEDKSYVLNCLQRLDDENLRISLPKCHFGKLEIDWLGYHISQSDVLPLESKTAAILSLHAPKTLKKIRSFWGQFIILVNSFLISPKLAILSVPYRKSHQNLSGQRNTRTISMKKNRIANATANCHYNPQLETRVKCDASRSGL